MKFKSLFILAFLFHTTVKIAYSNPWESLVTKVQEDLYAAKIPNMDLWLVMERISDSNYRSWRNYAKEQNSPQNHQNMEAYYKRKDGVDHFEQVLQQVSYRTNELWIAYITSDKNIVPNPVDGYS